MEKQKLSVGYAFLSLSVLISLIVSVVAFFNLAFEILNKKFPDVLNATYQYGYYSSQFEAARTFLAMLIIMFPIFLVIAYFWKRKEKHGLGHYDEVVRKWLSYIIIFLSILVVVIDLIILVRYFVAGEITIRFILKVLISLTGAKMILYYFVPEIWNVVFWKIHWRKFFKLSARYVSIAMALALIVWSFCVIGSPMKQRRLQLDDRRVQDLQSIQWQVINYWQQKEKLPATINDLKNPLAGYSLPIDPEFQKGKTYEYAVKNKNKLTFELCADFSLPMPKGWQEYQGYNGGGVMPMATKADPDIAVSNAPVSAVYPFPSGTNDSWDHQTGRTCFERTIDKDLYPPYPKILKNSQ